MFRCLIDEIQFGIALSLSIRTPYFFAIHNADATAKGRYINANQGSTAMQDAAPGSSPAHPPNPTANFIAILTGFLVQLNARDATYWDAIRTVCYAVVYVFTIMRSAKSTRNEREFQ
ncbi:hypothetical protein Trydic_g19673 [Trypoxylus dichotomus]